MWRLSAVPAPPPSVRNVREEYTLVWVDSMSTGTWYGSGQMKGSTLTFEGEHSDPMSGGANGASGSA